MTLIDRIKNICLTPIAEWPVIAAEPGSTAGLISGYVAPLAAVGAVAGFIGGSIVGRGGIFTGTYRVPVATGLILAVFWFVKSIVGVLLASFIVNALAPTFGAQKNSDQAMKVAAYSFTPGLLAGVLNIVPTLSALGILLILYGLYLLYLGLQALMKAPKDKAIAYTAVVVICWLVSASVATAVGATIGIGRAMGAGLIGGSASHGSAEEVQFGKDSPLGKLQLPKLASMKNVGVQEK